jgi:hypothetical protein
MQYIKHAYTVVALKSAAIAKYVAFNYKPHKKRFNLFNETQETFFR